jgi:hypothetical protein
VPAEQAFEVGKTLRRFLLQATKFERQNLRSRANRSDFSVQLMETLFPLRDHPQHCLGLLFIGAPQPPVGRDSNLDLVPMEFGKSPRPLARARAA